MLKFETHYLNLSTGPLHLVVDRPAVGSARGIIMIHHGLTSDAAGPCHVFEELARNLAARSFVVIRHDSYASGMSFGRFEDLSFDHMKATLRTLLDWVEQRWSNIPACLIGISLGTIACIDTASHDQRVRAMIGINCLIRDDIQPDCCVLIRNGEFRLGAAFMQSRSSVLIAAQWADLRQPKLMLYGELDQKLQRAYRGQAGFHPIAGADHLFTDPQSRTTLFTNIDLFLDEVFP